MHPQYPGYEQHPEAYQQPPGYWPLQQAPGPYQQAPPQPAPWQQQQQAQVPAYQQPPPAQQHQVQPPYPGQMAMPQESPEPQQASAQPQQPPHHQHQVPPARGPSPPLAHHRAVVLDTADLFCAPGRHRRPKKIAVIMRGLPGSGKSWLARKLRELELKNRAEAPRIHAIDDYFVSVRRAAVRVLPELRPGRWWGACPLAMPWEVAPHLPTASLLQPVACRNRSVTSVPACAAVRLQCSSQAGLTVHRPAGTTISWTSELPASKPARWAPSLQRRGLSPCLLRLQEVEKEEVEELPGKKPRTKTVRHLEYCYEAELEGEAPDCAVAAQCLQLLLQCTHARIVPRCLGTAQQTYAGHDTHSDSGARLAAAGTPLLSPVSACMVASVQVCG